MYILAKKNLNAENIENLSIQEIEHIGKMYNNPEYFEYFKKKMFLRWFFLNSENTDIFIKRTKKLIKKLSIHLSEKEQMKIDNLEPREFTARRAKKTIEAPYIGLNGSETLEKNIFFFYKDVRTYYRRKTLLELEHYGEIYLSSKEIVFYNRKENAIERVIYFTEIREIVLKKYAVVLEIRWKPNIYLRYKDNELIFISLKRTAPTKTPLEFSEENRNDDNTAERTLETILNWDDNDKPSKNKK